MKQPLFRQTTPRRQENPQADTANAISLYIHIPFCVRKCNYCAFYSVPKNSSELNSAYRYDLIAQARAIAPFERRVVKSIYFGGGTPSLLGAAPLARILAHLKMDFNCAEDAEITVEVNPKTVDLEDLHRLRRGGFNRISIGMQSSNDAELAMLGRIHTFSDVKECVQNAREAGFENISLDLLFGLPEQSLDTFRKSLTDAFAFSPEHLSVYSLQIEDGTPFCVNRDSLHLPTEEEEEAQYELLCTLARKNGYEHYEISSFAKDGHYSRHNLHYWQRGEYLGFGAAAHSHWNGKRFANPPDIFAGSREFALEEAYKKAERMDETEMLEEEIMLGLRTSFGIPARLVGEGRTECVERMISLGLMGRRGDRIFLTERGWRVSNAVIGQLLV